MVSKETFMIELNRLRKWNYSLGIFSIIASIFFFIILYINSNQYIDSTVLFFIPIILLIGGYLFLLGWYCSSPEPLGNIRTLIREWWGGLWDLSDLYEDDEK